MGTKIRDAERRRIKEALDAKNDGDWLKIASEIDYDRNQIYFWFLIQASERLPGATRKIVNTLAPFVLENPDADFNVSLIEVTRDEEIMWETLDDDDLRRGRLVRPPGSDPRRTARGEYTVFDRPDYTILPTDEPI